MIPGWLFKRAKHRIISALKPLKLDYNYELEAECFLYYITSLVADKYFRFIIPGVPNQQIRDILEARQQLYHNTPLHSLRGEWYRKSDLLRAQELSPTQKAFYIFGDLLLNSAARDDYEHAPVVSHEAMDYALFAERMTSEVWPIIVVYMLDVSKHCTTLDIRNTKERKKLNAAPSKLRPIIVLSLTPILFFLIMLSVFHLDNSTETSSSPTSDFRTTVPTQMLTPSPSPSPIFPNLSRVLSTKAPPIIPIYNGKLITPTDYEQVCPLTITADVGSNYYIKLIYKYRPLTTKENRTLKPYASSPYTSTLAFIVMSGCTVEIDVPIGVYKLFYATGNEFYGDKLLFGSTTSCYTADKLLVFDYADGYYNGHTITLRKVINGNFDTEHIPPDEFPKD